MNIPDGTTDGGHDFDRLYREIAPTLWRAIYSFSCGRRAIADEAVAEAFARAMENGVPIRSPRAWLYRTAFRIAAAELRDERAPLGEQEDYGNEPEVREVLGALRHLSPAQRAAVFLRIEADLPVREVAKLMGSTEAAVRVHLHRGRSRLRKILGAAEARDA